MLSTTTSEDRTETHDMRNTVMERKPPLVTSLLKWAGGKKWFAPDAAPAFSDYLEKSGGRYFEPFFGTGIVGMQVSKKVERFFTDKLEPLIEFHQTVRDHPGELAYGLSALALRGIDKENYYWVRDEYRPDYAVGRAARFLFLNRLSFNGLYRENKKGQFNVPYGDASDRKSIVGLSASDAITSLFPAREKIQYAHNALQGAVIEAADFQEVIEEAKEGDLVYCDPPYFDTFSNYQKDGFGEDAQERLAEALYYASERGAAVIAHNSLNEKVRYWYGDWCDIAEIQEKRSISAKGSSRQKASCALISNGKIP